MPNEEEIKKDKKLEKDLDNLELQADDLFVSTYSTSNMNLSVFNKVSGELSNTIQTAISGVDNENSGVNGTTQLYMRLFSNNSESAKKGSKYENIQSINDIFSNQEMMGNLMDIYSDTKYLKIIDNEIDMILKQMPKMKVALDVKKDNVLCADSFSKSFINVALKNNLQDINMADFSKNSKYIIDEYKFEDCAEKWYDMAATYGETFVYHVTYSKAFTELQKRKNGLNHTVTESFAFHPNGNIKDSSVGNIKLRLNKSGILEDAVNNYSQLVKLSESVMTMGLGGVNEDNTYTLNKTIDDKLSFEDDSTADGLIGTNKDKEKRKNINVPGAVVKVLDRYKVIPLYIEDICVGYYYINATFENGELTQDSYTAQQSIGNIFNGNAISSDNQGMGDEMLKMIAKQVADKIDDNFINTNQDLKKEIYMMLKYNDTYNMIDNGMNIDVTYIPPEDITHIKFTEDPYTHRGRSDMWDGMMSAKMWILLNTTTVIGNATRGQDKRVYYVKTQVETNVSKTLMNVVNQIKKGNFGIRQMESVNNILGIVGKFNDFVIPVGPSGDSPVSFDILSGQQFEMPQDTMQNLEDSAIGSIGVPLDAVSSAMQMDYAIHYTMTNGILLRRVMKRQAIYGKFLSDIFTKIYNYEFGSHETISVTLPMPSFLLMTQASQMIQNATQYIDAVTDFRYQDKDDTYKAKFKKKMISYYLPYYMDEELISKLENDITVEMSIDKTKEEMNGDSEA